MSVGLKAALAAYYTPEQLAQIKFEGGQAIVGDAAFALDGDKVKIAQLPANEWVRNEVSSITQERGIWCVVAYTKAFHFSSNEELIKLATTGEVYNEDYYTKRGGGSPYVNYPIQESGYDATQQFATLAAAAVKKFNPKTVLDCGCATGVFVKALQDLGVDARGIDISEYATSHAITQNVFRASGDKMPFALETFDLVVSQDFMEHIPPEKIVAVLTEQARVAKRGGKVAHFIPFEPDLETPRTNGVHLCEANRAFWVREISRVPAFKFVHMPPETDQWSPTTDPFSKYFVLEKI